MRFACPLVPATLIHRYKRFLADVTLPDGETITVHVANPGAMTGLAPPGARVWLSRSEKAGRKLAYSWELVEADLGAGTELIGVNTGLPNALVAEALAAAAIPTLAGYAQLRREVRYGVQSRVDFLLAGPGKPPCYLEVKNVHLMRAGRRAEFPDCVTARGSRHLDALAAMAAAGHRAVMLFVIQIASAECFTLARDIDPRYGAAFDRARAQGVEALAYRCAVSGSEIVVDREVPILG
jgi:sugar fermentation stimulation protein A